MSIPNAPIAATKPATKKERKAVDRRTRSGVEAAASKVMNLVGRLSESEQRKVLAVVNALVAKAD